jgi:hypothetical protein
LSALQIDYSWPLAQKRFTKARTPSIGCKWFLCREKLTSLRGEWASIKNQEWWTVNSKNSLLLMLIFEFDNF